MPDGHWHHVGRARPGTVVAVVIEYLDRPSRKGDLVWFEPGPELDPRDYPPCWAWIEELSGNVRVTSRQEWFVATRLVQGGEAFSAHVDELRPVGIPNVDSVLSVMGSIQPGRWLLVVMLANGRMSPAWLDMAGGDLELVPLVGDKDGLRLEDA